jgi:hypothetical protein
MTLKIDTVIEIYDRERNFRQTISRTTSLDPEMVANISQAAKSNDDG